MSGKPDELPSATEFEKRKQFFKDKGYKNSWIARNLNPGQSRLQSFQTVNVELKKKIPAGEA